MSSRPRARRASDEPVVEQRLGLVVAIVADLQRKARRGQAWAGQREATLHREQQRVALQQHLEEFVFGGRKRHVRTKSMIQPGTQLARSAPSPNVSALHHDPQTSPPQWLGGLANEHLGILPPSHSLYKSDYDVMQVLGRGGFGTVYRVRHRLDEREYAIKKVTIALSRLQSAKYRNVPLRDVLHRMLGEVRSLARLNHPNVIRYHHAWLELQDTPPTRAPSDADEEDDEGDNNDSDDDEWKGEEQVLFALEDVAEPSPSPLSPAPSSPSRTPLRRSSLLSALLTAPSPMSMSSPCHLDPGIQHPMYDLDNAVEFLPPISQSSSESDSESEGSSSGEVNVESENGPTSLVLYMQMELCEQYTLREWLDDSRQRGVVDAATNVGILQQVLLGLQHIHACGLIHRDLKPTNILVTRDARVVKIGDFGLSKDICEHTVRGGHTARPQHEPEGASSYLGTPVYASPEQISSQKNKTKLTSKADIYSLGIVMIEMYHPFDTDMERASVLKDARAGLIPPRLKKAYRREMALVHSMLSLDPATRPSVDALLSQPPFDEIGVGCLALHERLLAAEREIAKLRARNGELERAAGSIQEQPPT